MKLEEQLAELATLGLTLDEGVTVDDLLYSFDREAYEAEPFELILFVLGIEVEREPWGRPVCSRVWNFDTECINSSGDYERIAKRLCEVARKPDHLENVRDFVDLDAGEAWLKYEVKGISRYWQVAVEDDWADPVTVEHLMRDIESDGCRFFFKDNGQAMVLFYLDQDTADALNELSGDALEPVLRE